MGELQKITLYIVLFSLTASLFGAAGVDDAMGVSIGVDLSGKASELQTETRQEQDLSSASGLNIFYSGIQVGTTLLETLLSFPILIYSIVTHLIPGPLGVAIGVFLQGPADLLMALELASFLRGYDLY